MKANESVLWRDNKSAYRAAEQLGIKIKIRKINGQGYRIWRLTDRKDEFHESPFQHPLPARGIL